MNNRNFNNSFNNQFPFASDPNYSTSSPSVFNQMPQFTANPYTPPFHTNKFLVTGPEEALMRADRQNCLFVCFNQNKPEMYEVRVDNEGRKKIDTYYLTTTLNSSSSDYETRLRRLEEVIFKPVSGGIEEDVSAK